MLKKTGGSPWGPPVFFAFYALKNDWIAVRILAESRNLTRKKQSNS
jgi:hypothetical protein